MCISYIVHITDLRNQSLNIKITWVSPNMSLNEIFTANVIFIIFVKKNHNTLIAESLIMSLAKGSKLCETSVALTVQWADGPGRGSHGGRRWCRVAPCIVPPPDGLGPLHTADRVGFVSVLWGCTQLSLTSVASISRTATYETGAKSHSKNRNSFLGAMRLPLTPWMRWRFVLLRCCFRTPDWKYWFSIWFSMIATAGILWMVGVGVGCRPAWYRHDKH